MADRPAFKLATFDLTYWLKPDRLIVSPSLFVAGTFDANKSHAARCAAVRTANQLAETLAIIARMADCLVDWGLTGVVLCRI
jgi:hypothetical protein